MHANFQGERSKTYRDLAEQIFVSEAYLFLRLILFKTGRSIASFIRIHNLISRHIFLPFYFSLTYLIFYLILVFNVVRQLAKPF